MTIVLAARHRFTPVTWLVVLGFAVLFRLELITASPYLISDFERYLFDGRLLLAGINPYDAQPISFPELGGQNVPRPEIKTIYPPLAQLLFGAAVWLGDTLSHWRLMSLVPDLLGALVLSKILQKCNRPLSWLMEPLALEGGASQRASG